MNARIVESSRNSIGNVYNRFQGSAKRVLCVCSAGLLRSPTLANILHEEYGYNTRAAGLEVNYALIPVSEALLEWADEIIVMEYWMETTLREVFTERYGDEEAKVLYNLNIPDNFAYGEVELKAMLLAAYAKHLGVK